MPIEAPGAPGAQTTFEHPRSSRGRNIAMAVGTILAMAALLSEVPSLSALWDTIRHASWWWIGVAVLFTLGNKVGYALALMGSVSLRLPFLRSVEALIAAAFSNLAVPGLGGTAVQVRYLQVCGVEIAAAVAAGAILANVANVVVQGALFLVALVFTSVEIDTSKIDVEHIAGILRTVVLLAGVVVAIAYGFPRFRARTLPPTKRAWATIKTALRSPRQLLLLVVGNLCAALMSALCVFACVRAYGGDVAYGPILVANIVVGTVASLIPVPGGNTLVSAVGLSTALVAFGAPDTVAVAAVITQQIIATYLPALPGWFATNDMLRRGYL
jgi:glycosyltransferase 2 family protein